MKTIKSRAGGLLGLIGVALLVVGNELSKIGGGSPPLHASADLYQESVATSDLALLGVYLIVFAWLALGGFFAVLAHRLAPNGPGHHTSSLVTASGAVTAAVGIGGAPPLLTAMVLAQDGDLTASIAKTLLLLNAVLFVLSWLTLAAAIALSSVLILRQGEIRPWLGRSGIPLAALLATGSVAVWHYEAAFLTWLLTLIWIAAASIALARLTAPEPDSPRTPAPSPHATPVLGPQQH